MSNSNEDQLSLDINEAQGGGDLSSRDAEYSPGILNLIDLLKMSPEQMSILEEQSGSLRRALLIRGASEKQISEAFNDTTLEVPLEPEPLAEVDMSNVKTAYSPINVDLGERALHLIAASEAASHLGRGRTKKDKRRCRDIVDKEVNLANGEKIMIESGEDPFETTFQGLMDANKLIKRYGGPDKKEARENFIKTQKHFLK